MNGRLEALGSCITRKFRGLRWRRKLRYSGRCSQHGREARDIMRRFEVVQGSGTKRSRIYGGGSKNRG